MPTSTNGATSPHSGSLRGQLPHRRPQSQPRRQAAAHGLRPHHAPRRPHRPMEVPSAVRHAVEYGSLVELPGRHSNSTGQIERRSSETLRVAVATTSPVLPARSARSRHRPTTAATASVTATSPAASTLTVANGRPRGPRCPSNGGHDRLSGHAEGAHLERDDGGHQPPATEAAATSGERRVDSANTDVDITSDGMSQRAVIQPTCGRLGAQQRALGYSALRGAQLRPHAAADLREPHVVDVTGGHPPLMEYRQEASGTSRRRSRAPRKTRRPHRVAHPARTGRPGRGPHARHALHVAARW